MGNIDMQERSYFTVEESAEFIKQGVDANYASMLEHRYLHEGSEDIVILPKDEIIKLPDDIDWNKDKPIFTVIDILSWLPYVLREIDDNNKLSTFYFLDIKKSSNNNWMVRYKSYSDVCIDADGKTLTDALYKLMRIMKEKEYDLAQDNGDNIYIR